MCGRAIQGKSGESGERSRQAAAARAIRTVRGTRRSKKRRRSKKKTKRERVKRLGALPMCLLCERKHLYTGFEGERECCDMCRRARSTRKRSIRSGREAIPMKNGKGRMIMRRWVLCVSKDVLVLDFGRCYLSHVFRVSLQVRGYSDEDLSSSDDGDDDDPSVRRSAITGKRIKLKRDQTAEDRAYEASRAVLRHYMNSQY